MGKNLKYGEFDFGQPKTAMKKGGMCKTDTGYAKGGPKMPAKREPEAMVRKEVALLRKAGAPKALIRHEMTEMSEPKALKKGGAAKMDMKMGKVMREYGDRELHSGSKTGPIVENPKQALAIAYSEGRKAQKLKKGGSVEAKLEKHANLPASKAHGPGAGNKLAKGGVPTFSKTPKFGKTK